MPFPAEQVHVVVANQAEKTLIAPEPVKTGINLFPSAEDVPETESLELFNVPVQNQREGSGVIVAGKDLGKEMRVVQEVIRTATVTEVEVTEKDKLVPIREGPNGRPTEEVLEVPFAKSILSDHRVAASYSMPH
jgi:hypothetical protein